ncbi:hypothetical protein ALP80_05044 [Pseudomonas savastanoi pv. fraxini]|nr:hypothetical protein ALP80_05044 [Pseudomonas savastanoi pv. fraxini]RMR74015.1 hypothetical protein ALP81_05083 [Pseudomonas savastanoi pv. fraxini]
MAVVWTWSISYAYFQPLSEQKGKPPIKEGSTRP